MAYSTWRTTRLKVASLHLDAKNPRLGRETNARAPREIIQYLFDHDKALVVAESIALRGYFPNEPLLAVKEGNRIVVIEGNRRLAALKALREPGLLEGKNERAVQRLARRITDIGSLATVPVTIAPSRHATDRQIAGRHVGTPVLAWTAENRASFILEKLEEGYSNDDLRDELGFTLTDIQKARQTRSIADMARSLTLPEEVRAKLDNPRARIFTTIERVLDSPPGRVFFKIERDNEHGLQGTTTKKEFVKGFTKLVTDIALSRQDSRKLNKHSDIEDYLKKWDAKSRPIQKSGRFVPADIIEGGSVASPKRDGQTGKNPRRPKRKNDAVLPRDLSIRHGTDKILDIRNELVKIKRSAQPNAGAVLLRVFFELSILNYLERTGELDKLTSELKKKGKLSPHGAPTMRQLVPTITRIAKSELSKGDATMIEKALRHDPAAPFSVNDLHAFVHNSSDLPGERDIEQFWLRTEPLFRLMLETD